MLRFPCVVALALCLTSSAVFAQELPRAKQPIARFSSGSILIVTSQSGKTLYGYSEQTGMWDSVAVVNPGKSSLMPRIGTSIAYIRVGKRLYAFSAATGRWATFDLPEEGESKIDHNVGHLRVDVGSKIFMFSATTGKWSYVDLAVDKE
jgi:hypothetical protein